MYYNRLKNTLKIIPKTIDFLDKLNIDTIQSHLSLQYDLHF
jgi:hypothetical protein